MECQDATAHIADYLAGSLPVEKRGASDPCGGLRRMPRQADSRGRDVAAAGTIPPGAPDLPAMRRRFDAVLPTTRTGSAAVRETFASLQMRHLPFPRASCSWICRRRFTADQPFERSRWWWRNPRWRHIGRANVMQSVCARQVSQHSSRSPVHPEWLPSGPRSESRFGEQRTRRVRGPWVSSRITGSRFRTARIRDLYRGPQPLTAALKLDRGITPRALLRS